MQFSDLGLVAELLRAVEEQGYTTPTPIQEQGIPPILQGQDVMAGAQTGTGKTAAFTLPMLQRLKPHASTSVSPARHPVRALILTPTRELAAQVYESVRDYGKHIPLRSACVYGGVNIDPQIAELRAGIEILVATPGRLLDHVHQRTVNLGQVEIFILDEADRMLDMGFMPDIKRIVALLPAKRQNLMFSATFPDDIKRLADQILTNPARLQIARRNTVAELVTHSAYKVDPLRKQELLSNLIRSRDIKQVLVFTSTKISANRLARQLERDGFSCAAQHSDKSQQERTAALAAFKEGKVQVLVATDVAARGLDIEHLPLVINYELPPNPDDYIHRIGRTGRAGMAGEAISLVAPDEREALASIEKLIKMTIPVQPTPESDFRPPEASPRRREHGHARARDTSRGQSRSAQPALAVSAIESSLADASSSMDAMYVASAERAIKPPVPNVERRPRQVAALFLPPVTAKQD